MEKVLRNGGKCILARRPYIAAPLTLLLLFVNRQVQPRLDAVNIDAHVAQEAARKAVDEPMAQEALDELLSSMPSVSEVAEIAYQQQREAISSWP